MRVRRWGRGFIEADLSPYVITHECKATVGYNAGKIEHFPLIVFAYPLRLACFLAVIVTLNCASSAQTATAPAKPPARLALQRGQEAVKSGDIARARAEFEKAVRLAANDAQAQSALGWVLAQQGEADAAVAHLRIAIKAAPQFAEARLTLAGVLSQQGKSAEAERVLRDARERGCAVSRKVGGQHVLDDLPFDPSVEEYQIIAPIAGG